MNLRELLLQFAGENDISLKVEDIVMANSENIYIMEEIPNGVKAGVIEDSILEETKEKIKNALISNGYEPDIYLKDSELYIEAK